MLVWVATSHVVRPDQFSEAPVFDGQHHAPFCAQTRFRKGNDDLSDLQRLKVTKVVQPRFFFFEFQFFVLDSVADRLGGFFFCQSCFL